ncbi:mannitol-1-phosphate 5-dehydrogenase [Pullulanibacillus sp. KACC 23026]|uniref:mannitol-1-phosphate 5-dehydrogenase n=1 Tax=Pullulanibacillus sp. KACC 23026 TaxID=3028315 RepID=UPI0023B1041F|nr:mannitol-1-phosphate 5-dehydrogenase [Pullulanibacillus sp. KACC 23026]WEG12893.1 mannitol-1-phosphate 5-dehydrogenase [Pullulanibacillus sp. KACC 23026]
MKAVHFGAGNIGRGFIGKLLYQSGYHTTFVDVNGAVVDLLNEKKSYQVILADESQETVLVEDVSAINSQTNPDDVVQAIVEADLVTAAVGPHILPAISGLVAKGLQERLAKGGKPLNIIACENMIGGSSLLKEKVYEKIDDNQKGQFDKHYGFPNAAVDRIVPNQKNEDPLTVKVEPFYEWVVEETKLVGERPKVEGIHFVSDLEPYIERKLFTVNTGHASAAYLGYQAGIKTIDQAMSNDAIKEAVKKTLQETGRVLIKRYGFDEATHQAYIDKIMSRFVNPYITDEVTRVGRSPIRKLGPQDRLVRPATQYIELFGEQPENLAKVMAAVLHFDTPDDPEAVELQNVLKEKGPEEALATYTKLPKDSSLLKLVVELF